MSTLYLNREKAKQWTRAQKSQYKANAGYQEASVEDFKKLASNAGLSPDEAYREMDNLTVAIMNPAGEFATYSRVNSVSKSVNLGKLDYTYRQASEQAGGTVSLSGQTGIITDAVEYKNAGTVIPVIDHGTKRDWREYLTFGADGFDTMVDDARECELVTIRTANDYLWNGDATIKSPDGRVWLGITADPSLVQETTAVDLASPLTDPQDIVDEVGAKLDILRITNNCSNPVDLGVSREIMSHWDRTPYSVGDKTFGSLLDYISKLNGIASVYEEPKLSGGKEFLMAFINQMGLHAVTGQAMSSYMKQRVMHNDPYIMVKWMAQGFIAKADFKGQKCALYCKSAQFLLAARKQI